MISNNSEMAVVITEIGFGNVITDDDFGNETILEISNTAETSPLMCSLG